ncbi:low voltage-gated calcium channel [Aureococcus anophagefferens]|nr:low voltage-gated calcium channel [Aureococcus anophagefferens]
MASTTLFLKMKKEKKKEEDEKEEEGEHHDDEDYEDFDHDQAEKRISNLSYQNAEIRTNVCKVIETHTGVVFGDDDAAAVPDMDYYWYDEPTERGYGVSWAEGCYSFRLSTCGRAICRSHVDLVRHQVFEVVVNGTIGLVAVAFTMHLVARPDLSKPSDARLWFFVVFVKYCSMVVFAAEMVVKVVAEGSRPLRYWTGPESTINTFDSTIVILSFALMGGGGGEAILPVLRLARLAKLLNRTAETRRVLYGIIAGCRAMVSIIVLLGLIMFLYAIIGVKSFGENDPAHFGTVPIAMLTLFVASTCSDWSHMLQINYKGCDKGGEDWPYYDADELTEFRT